MHTLSSLKRFCNVRGKLSAQSFPSFRTASVGNPIKEHD